MHIILIVVEDKANGRTQLGPEPTTACGNIAEGYIQNG